MNPRRAFTVIELLIVLAIIAVLAGIGAPVAVGALRGRDVAHDADRLQRAHAIAQGLAQRQAAGSVRRFGVALLRADGGPVEVAVVACTADEAARPAERVLLDGAGQPVFRASLRSEVRVSGEALATTAAAAWFYAERSGSLLAVADRRFQPAQVGATPPALGTTGDPWLGLTVDGAPLVIRAVVVAPPTSEAPGLELRSRGGQRRQVVVSQVGVMHERAF